MAGGFSEHCVTCGDVAEPMTVLRIDEARELALCRDGEGVHHTVEIALVQPVAIDDELLVHAGTAIA
jgi:hydrogenase maturation factor